MIAGIGLGVALGWGCETPRMRDEIAELDGTTPGRDFGELAAPSSVDDVGDTRADVGPRNDGSARAEDASSRPNDAELAAIADALSHPHADGTTRPRLDAEGAGFDVGPSADGTASPRLDGDLPDGEGAASDAHPGEDGSTPPRLDADLPDAEGAASDAHPGEDGSTPPRLDAELSDTEGEGADVRSGQDAEHIEPDAGVDDAAALDFGRLRDGPDLGTEIDAGGLSDARPDLETRSDSAVGDGDLPHRLRFIEGIALAADHETPVRVRAGAQTVIAEPDGAFVLGPLQAGAWVVEFEATEHQSETLEVHVPEDTDVALQAPMVLYRGQRVGLGLPTALRFGGRDEWLVWAQGTTLYGSATGPPETRALVAEDHEILIGFVPGGQAVTVRRRTEPGVAGDIDLIPLDGEAPVPLFRQAQPRVLWVADRALALVETDAGLSRLASVVPGEAAVILAEEVPRLVVATLNDGTLVWTAGSGPGAGVWRGAADGSWSEIVSRPTGPASSAFLMTTPQRTGVMWLDPDGGLWRWTLDGGEIRLAQAVSASPRPQFLAHGDVLFWRAEPAGTHTAFVWEQGAGQRLLVVGADGHSLRITAEIFHVVRPGRGLYRGHLDGSGSERLLEGVVDGFTTYWNGVIALMEGALWRYTDRVGPEWLGDDGRDALSTLQSAPFGATAWFAPGGILWWIPSPGRPGVPTVLVEGADRLGRSTAYGGTGLYVLGPEGYRFVALPPRPDGEVRFDAHLVQIQSVDEARVLGLDEQGGLWQVNPLTGQAFGWASQVRLLTPSPGRGFAAYVCDRGVFLAPIPER